METRERTITNSYEQVRKKEYALNEREDALIQNEADLNFNSERRKKTISNGAGKKTIEKKGRGY